MGRDESFTPETHAAARKLILELGDKAYNMSKEDLLIVNRIN